MSFIIVYITHANESEATKVTDFLIEHKFAACANIFPIKSAYWWKGDIENNDEFVSIVKTIPENWEALKAEVEKIHPYDVPCIMKLKVEANPPYEQWIRDAVEVK